MENESQEVTENAEITVESPEDQALTAESKEAEVSAVEEEKLPEVKKTKEKSSLPSDDFDWSMDKEGFAKYDDGSRNSMMELYKGTFNQLTENQVVTGTVVAMNNKDVVINVGYKSDGIINRTEFRELPDLKVGDKVEVFVEKTEDSLGQLILSRRKAIAESAWDKIVAAKDENQILTGYIKSRTKGGLVVDIMGMDTFLPGSQIDVKPIKDYDVYVGQTMEFKVVKVNEAFKNIVISHKALIEDDIEAQKGEILSRMEKGQVLEGVVKNMTNFGVFIDLGGLDGLLHITDISWGRVNHPEEVLQLEQKINVVVLDFDDEKKRISLGLKQLTENPWNELTANLEVGSTIKGKVVTVADYGAFVEISPGIEGLIHVSEMSWSQHLKNPQDFMKVGDEIEAVILSLDKDEQKMSLGVKQLIPDPWEKIEEKYPVGSKHQGIVRNLTNYGLFIELEEGVDGLVHVSDLSWSKKIKHPAEFIKKGEDMEVVVLEIDRENRRLSLGHKQLDENPWETFESIFHQGSEHVGTITEVNDKGATVSLPYGVEGFAPTKHIKKEGNKAGNGKVDDELNFRVIEFNKDQKRIILSHTDIWKDAERAKKESEKTDDEKNEKQVAKTVARFNQQTERSTLGEIEALSDLKALMDSNAKKAKQKAESEKENVKETPKKEEKAPKAEKSESGDKKTKSAKTAKPVSKESEAPSENDDKVAQLIDIVGKVKASDKNDLKKIVGIGPKFEENLNNLGIYSFEQISKLDKDGVALVEELIKSPGRVERENWIGQVQELMKG
ncbi:MAG: 30S ribosomal protein S1 [Flavobacteriales bacterium]|nr:30S ribosomal protein S1 [Flavobacteriales bacterium]